MTLSRRPALARPCALALGRSKTPIALETASEDTRSPRVPTVFGLECQATTMSDGIAISVEELVEYCRTQSGLLSGRVETISEEADDLLDDIDEAIAEMRTRLEERESSARASTVSSSTSKPTVADDELAELEEMETELEEKQAIAEAKQARMAAFQDLAVAYTELAEELESAVEGRKVLDRVVRFERDHDAPAYFHDRRTILEAVAEADDSTAE